MIELPYPAKILWPNGRTRSHMFRHREFQKHKGWALAATLALFNGGRPEYPAGEPIQWSVTFYPKTRHAVDDDNARASLKAYQDGIAAALKVDDKRFAAPVLHWGEPVKGGKVVVTIA